MPYSLFCNLPFQNFLSVDYCKIFHIYIILNYSCHFSDMYLFIIYMYVLYSRVRSYFCRVFCLLFSAHKQCMLFFSYFSLLRSGNDREKPAPSQVNYYLIGGIDNVCIETQFFLDDIIILLSLGVAGRDLVMPTVHPCLCAYVRLYIQKLLFVDTITHWTIDMWSWFQQLARMMKLCTRPIVLTVTFFQCHKNL